MVSFWSFLLCVLVSLLFLLLSINISRVLSLTLCLPCLHAPSQGSASLPRLQVYPLLCRGIPGPPWTCQKSSVAKLKCAFSTVVCLWEKFSVSGPPLLHTVGSKAWGYIWRHLSISKAVSVVNYLVCLFENIWISFWLNQLKVPLSFEKGIYAHRKFYKVCT